MTTLTDIPDPESAKAVLGAMVHAAERAATRLRANLAKINGLDTGAAWGTSDTVAVGRKQYETANGGANVVKTNVVKIPEELRRGIAVAVMCVVNVQELDDHGKNLFRIDPTVADVIGDGHSDKPRRG